MFERILSRDAKGPAAVFIDRDGTITEGKSYTTKPEHFRLIEGAAEGIRLLNKAGLAVIVVTNQPVVARGLCTEEDVEAVHEKMLKELVNRGAKLDAIYWCPHSKLADVPEYRKDCVYRKPSTGMLEAAAKRFGLELGKCFVVGDSVRDVLAGKRAGCTTIGVETGSGCKDKREDVKGKIKPDYLCKNLKDAAALILGMMHGK